MKWFRKWFGRQPAGRSHCARCLSRPCLETLEERCVPSISHAFLQQGATTLIAFNNGVLEAVTGTSTSVIATGVKNAHAYRDPAGRLGMDIVFNNGMAVLMDSTETRVLGSNVQEASTTFDRRGSFLTLLTLEDGTLLALTPQGTTVVGNNFAGASTYLDLNGRIGVYFNFKLGSGTFLAQSDSTTPVGLVLGPGFKDAQANSGPNGQFFVDLTLDNGDTFETTRRGTQFLGNQF